MIAPLVTILDDEPEIRRILDDVLQEAGFRTQCFARAREFEAALKHVTPDVCLVDLSLPDTDGLALVHRLALEQGASVIIISGRAQVQDRVTGLELGADDYITKPFDIQELELRIKAILRRCQPPPALPAADILTVGPLSLNCRTFEATINDRTVLLTPIEFELLHHLMSHPGEVFSSERLLQEVWDYPPGTGDPALVRMHIKNLRDKLEPDARNPSLIRTVSRHGYTVRPE